MGLRTIVRGLFGVRHDLDADQIVIEPSPEIHRLGASRLSLDFGENLFVKVDVTPSGEVSSSHSFPQMAEDE